MAGAAGVRSGVGGVNRWCGRCERPNVAGVDGVGVVWTLVAPPNFVGVHW